MTFSESEQQTHDFFEARKLQAAYAPYGTLAERLIPGVCKHVHTRCTHGYEQLRVGLVACLDCGRGVKNQDPPATCWWTGEPHLTQLAQAPRLAGWRTTLAVRLNRSTRWLR